MSIPAFRFIGLKSMSPNVTFDKNLRNAVTFCLAQLMTEKSLIKVAHAPQMLGD